MNITDSIRFDGLNAALSTDRESVTIAGRKVAAIVDRAPRTFDMMDAGYMNHEPVSIEVHKGTTSSTATTMIDGVSVPNDLRGYAPRKLDEVVLNTVLRLVQSVDNSGPAWVITTIRANT